MRIQELLVEGFGDWANLQLPKFLDGLNVIRVPSQDDSNLLRACFELALVSNQGTIRPRRPVQASRITAIFDNGRQTTRTRELSISDDGQEVVIHQGLPWSDSTADVTEALTRSYHEPAVIVDAAVRYLLPSTRLQRKSSPEFDSKTARRELFELQTDIETLLAKRAKLCRRLAPGELHESYFQDQQELADLTQQKLLLSKRCDSLVQQHRVFSSAVELSELWMHREKLKRQLEKIQPVDPSGLATLDDLNNRLRQQRHLQKRIRRQLKNNKRTESPAEPKVDPRIEAAVAQEDWLYKTKQTVDSLRNRIKELHASAVSPGGAKVNTKETALALKPYASALRTAKRDLDEAEQRYAEKQSEIDAQAATPPVVTEPVTDEAELRLQQLLQQREHLKDEIEGLRIECRELLKRQTMSMPVFLSLAALFAAGVAMVFAGLLLEMNGVEWACIAMGMTASAAATLLRVSYSRSNNERIRARKRRIGQLNHAIEDNKLLFEEISAGDHSSLARRFVRDEPSEDATERLIRQQLNQHLDSLVESVDEHQARYDRACARWQDALAKNQLPRDLSPQQALKRLRSDAEATRNRRKEASLRRAEVFKLNAELKLNEEWLQQWRDNAIQLVSDHDLSDRISVDGLLSLLKRQPARIVDDSALDNRGEAKQLRVDLSRSNQKMKQIARERRQLLDAAQCKNEAEYRQRVDDAKRRGRLSTELDELNGTIKQRFEEDEQGQDIEQLLIERKAAEIVQEASQHANTLRDSRQRLQQLADRVTQQERRIKSLVDDQHAGSTKLELEVIESRLAELRRRWQRQALWVRAGGMIEKEPEPQASDLSMNSVDEILPGLTAGRIRGLRYLSGSGELLAEQTDGLLSIKKLEQVDRVAVALAIRLAVHQTLAPEQSLPIVVGDAFLNGLRTSIPELVATVHASAERGLQLFLITADPKLVDACLKQQIPVAFVSREYDKRMHVTPPSPRPVDVAHPTVAPAAHLIARDDQQPPAEERELLVPEEARPALKTELQQRTEPIVASPAPNSVSELITVGYEEAHLAPHFDSAAEPPLIDVSDSLVHRPVPSAAANPPHPDRQAEVAGRVRAEQVHFDHLASAGDREHSEDGHLPRLSGAEPPKLGSFRLDPAAKTVPDSHLPMRPMAGAGGQDEAWRPDL